MYNIWWYEREKSGNSKWTSFALFFPVLEKNQYTSSSPSPSFYNLISLFDFGSFLRIYRRAGGARWGSHTFHNVLYWNAGRPGGYPSFCGILWGALGSLTGFREDGGNVWGAMHHNSTTGVAEGEAWQKEEVISSSGDIGAPVYLLCKTMCWENASFLSLPYTVLSLFLISSPLFYFSLIFCIPSYTIAFMWWHLLPVPLYRILSLAEKESPRLLGKFMKRYGIAPSCLSSFNFGSLGSTLECFKEPFAFRDLPTYSFCFFFYSI